ncbi:MAG: CerR family C-terminal domain-containing protein [Sulfuricella sp.]|nr:CerR family C-terminal domain-containing protein [Sulfuricella sp.]
MPNHAETTSGHEARSAKTRSQLIEATIDVVAAVGYEGATTRALAQAAKTTLSAIPYHFGSKKELYLAAAEMIAEYAANRFAEAAALLDDTPDIELSVRFERALIQVLHTMLDEAEPHAWTAFVARCAYDNDDAFALILERAIAPLQKRLVHAASQFSGRSSDDEALRMRVIAILTAIFSFRFLRGVMLRGMDWKSIRNEATKQITDMVHDLCRSGFLTVWSADDGADQKTGPSLFDSINRSQLKGNTS